MPTGRPAEHLLVQGVRVAVIIDWESADRPPIFWEYSKVVSWSNLSDKTFKRLIHESPARNETIPPYEEAAEVKDLLIYTYELCY